MNRRDLDPLWDLGLGFGPVRHSRTLELPWESGPFAFLNRNPRTELQVLQGSLLAVPTQVPRPIVVADNTQQVVSRPSVPPPRARAAHQGWQVSRAREERQSALSKWSALIRYCPNLFGSSVAAQVLDENVRIELGNLEVVFCKKSSNTLLQRAFCLKKFAVWCVHRFPQEGLSEGLLFLYLQELREQAASASAADSLLSALAFTHGTLGLSLHLDVLRTPRVTGLAHLQLRTRRPPRQAQVLSVAQVRHLEQVAGEDPRSYKSLVAGGLCFCLFARARNSDAKRSQTVAFDWDRTGTAGYVEASVLNPKQARASSRSNKLLPLAAPVLGLLDKPWAKSWQESRLRWSLECAGTVESSPIIPAIASNGDLLPASLSSAEVTRWLRSILSEMSDACQDNILRISSHSLKATLLSWTAKVDVGWDNQTLLGYHSLGVNRSSLNYSRDALSGPLRRLVDVLSLVSSGRFDPDDTRSGRWRQTSQESSELPQRGFAQQALQQATTVESSSDSGGSVAAPSSASEDEQLVAQDCSHTLSLVVGSGCYSYRVHDLSHICHLVVHDQDRFLCGRSVFGKYSVCKSLSATSNRLCHNCHNIALAQLDDQWAAS